MKLPRWAQLDLKESRVNKVVLMGLNMPGPIDHIAYGALAKESYERSVPVFACVSEVMKAAASVPWVLMQQSRSGAGGKFAGRYMTPDTARKSFMFHGKKQHIVRKQLEQTEVEQHPLLTLIERPNPWQAQAEFIAQQVGYWLLSGNSYEEFASLKTKQADAPPQEMYNLRPDRTSVLPNNMENRRQYPELVKFVPDPTSWVLGYQYELNGKKENFEPQAIIHKKFFHPTNDWYGLSPLQVAARAYRTDNVAADWNFALLKNQGRPSGALVSPHTVEADAFDRMKKEMEDMISGADSAGRPMFLTGGLEWVQFGMSPLEMDWLLGRRFSRVEICSVFNVPPELIGDNEHKTYNSFPEARRAFWMEAVLPILDAIRDAWNMRLVPLYGDNLFLDYDRDQIDALAENQEAVWNRVNKATHISTNEKRDATGYDQYEGDPETDDPQDVPRELVKVAAPAGPNPFGDEPDPELEPEPKPDDNAEKKEQVLTNKQKVAMVRMKRAVSKVFKAMGKEMAAELKAAADQLS